MKYCNCLLVVYRGEDERVDSKLARTAQGELGERVSLFALWNAGIRSAFLPLADAGCLRACQAGLIGTLSLDLIRSRVNDLASQLLDDGERLEILLYALGVGDSSWRVQRRRHCYRQGKQKTVPCRRVDHTEAVAGD